MIFECKRSAQLSPYVESFILQWISSRVSYLPQDEFDLLINESHLNYPAYTQILSRLFG
ncbi:hypothetical protein PA25_37340 [Pseudoalteromonas sp. A25]|nr:hypothetical protein PA25_37340 [Pseudoalteromonas sp. A25]